MKKNVNIRNKDTVAKRKHTTKSRDKSKMTQASPLVSILIGAKDRPDALIRCVKSVLAQAYKNLEVLVLDDNSEEKLCGKLTETVTDSRVRCIRSDITLGVAGGRNILIKKAKGDFIVTLDDDAVLKYDESLDKIIELFNRYPDVVLFAFKIIDIVNGKQVCFISVPEGKRRICVVDVSAVLQFPAISETTNRRQAKGELYGVGSLV